MTVQTSTSSSLAATAASPSVNLLPPEIAEAAKFRRFQFAMGGVVALAVVAVGYLFVGAHHDADNAKGQIAAAQQQEANYQSQVSALQSVSTAYSQLAGAKALLAQAEIGQVHWSYQLEDLSLRIPDSVWLTNFAITPSTTTATTETPGATTPSVITPADQVASISFTGDALARDDVAKWLDAVSAEPGWSDPYVTSISETAIGSRNVYQFAGTIDVTSSVLAHKAEADLVPPAGTSVPSTTTTTPAGS